jgi:tetratricopeptide (TPR) repeat protein
MMASREPRLPCSTDAKLLSRPLIMKHFDKEITPERSSTSPRIAVLFAIALQFCIVSAGCVTDPVVRERRFVAEGDRYFAQEKFPEALITFGRALQMDPKSPDLHYRIAKCQLKLSNWASVYQELQRTIVLEPQHWKAQLDLGQLYLDGGKAAEAKNQALLILRDRRADLGAQILMANADAQLGNLSDALREAAQAVSAAPNDSEAYVSLSIIQQRALEFEDAEANLLKAGKLAPDSMTAPMALGNLYEVQKRWGDAETAFRQAIATAPTKPGPRVALATMFIAKGQSDLAERVLREAKEQLSADPAAYRMLGDYYLSQGDSAKALAEFMSLSKDHPNDSQVRKACAQLLILDRQLEEASRLTDEILKRSPQDDEGLVLKGQILLQSGKTDDALHALLQAKKGNPADAVGHYHLGMAYLVKGNTNQAEGEWRTAVQLRPDLSDAWVALGKSATDRHDWKDLESIGVHLMKIAPNSPGGFLFHATARINQGDAASSEADLKQLIQISPQSPQGYVKLGQLRVLTKRWNEAEILYREALNRSPDFLDAIQGIVDLDFQRGHSEDALHFLNTKIDADPNNATLYFLQGQSYLRIKQLAPAKQSFSRCIDLDKKQPAAFIMLAQVEQTLGNVADAIANYRRAIALAPNNDALYATTGVLYDSQGNWQEAETWYQKALSIQPDEALAANNLAYLLLEHGGNVTVALTLAQTARRGLPKVPGSADTLGWAYYQNSAYSLAVPLLEEAVRAVPSNAAYRYHLGMTYQKLNDIRRARIEFEKSIRVAPNDPSALKASRALSELSGS